jgi:hypothetical protein
MPNTFDGQMLNPRAGWTHELATLRQEDGAVLREFLAMFGSPAQGRLMRKQTTYWDVGVTRLGSQDPAAVFRVHFDLKQEFRYPEGSFSHVELADVHPLLLDYSDPHRQVFVSGPAVDTEGVLAALSDEVDRATAGWRSLASYANSQWDPGDILRSGAGKLLEAPATVAQGLAAVLEQAGVRFTMLEGRPARPRFEVLTLGEGFVVARGFRLGSRT